MIAKAPTRRTGEGGEAWTVPVVFTTSDKDSRWAIEDIFRKSNMFPTYHWPKEFLDPVKELRKTVIEMGVDPGTNYIRIRPEEREGNWKIRADVKPKEGNGKFTLKAKWNIPPLETEIRQKITDWKNPAGLSPTLPPSHRDPPPHFAEDSNAYVSFF